MKTFLHIAAWLLVPLTALADRLVTPTGGPPAFAAECGACHLAFPPALLDARGWHLVMTQLDHHYGDNAGLDEKTRQTIETFLIQNAGGDTVRGTPQITGEPPRLTATPWFRRKHHEVPARVWQDPRLKGPANCAACHKGAAEGSYREREIVMPNGRPWEEGEDD